MLDNLSATGEWIYQQAEHCARQANAQTDLKVKQQFLELKRLWLLLARAQSLTKSSELARTADKMAKLEPRAASRSVSAEPEQPHRLRRLLCTRGERPNGYRTNSSFDEIASSDCLPKA